jgi:hypothetical protein
MSEPTRSSWDSVLKSAVERDQKEKQAAYGAVSRPAPPPRSGSSNFTWLLVVIAAVVLFFWYRHR